MSNQESDKAEISKKALIETGAEVGGGLAGAAIGLAAAGPVGAFVGSAVAPLVTRAIRKIALDFRNRSLSPAELRRVDTALVSVASKIEENLANGRQVRQDDFFTPQPDDRAAGEEIMEAVLLAAQREYEEKKVYFYGNLLANIAFTPEIDRSYANYLLRRVQQMSYRQVCLLTIFVGKRRLELSHLGESNFTFRSLERKDLVQDLHEMREQGIIKRRTQEFAGDDRPIEDYGLSMVEATTMGEVLYSLMELAQTNQIDLETFMTQFR